MSGFWHRFADIAKVVAPVVLSVVPGVPPVLGPIIAHAIIDAQSLPGASGAEKKAHVLAIVGDALAVADVAGKPIGDASVIVPAVSNGVDAVVSTVNAIKAAHVEPAVI